MASATVLVVDDDRAVCQIVQMALEDEGYRVLCADDEPGLDAALAERPDLILLDLHLPRLEAAGLVARLRADATTARVPIVAFSAGKGAPDVQADDELAKPFHLDALYAVVRRWAGSPIP